MINNIEGIVGGGGLAAGVLTAIGTAALLAAPYVKEWAKSIGFAGEKIPESKDAIERYTDAINRNKEAIKTLKEQESLNYFEMQRYTKLLDETKKLEEELANAGEARAIKDGSSKKDRERAAAVRETISEKFGSGQELIDTIMATDQGKGLGLKRVEEIVADAMRGTGAGAKGLENISPEFKKNYAEFSPETKAANKKSQEQAAANEKVQAMIKQANDEQRPQNGGEARKRRAGAQGKLISSSKKESTPGEKPAPRPRRRRLSTHGT